MAAVAVQIAPAPSRTDPTSPGATPTDWATSFRHLLQTGQTHHDPTSLGQTPTEEQPVAANFRQYASEDSSSSRRTSENKQAARVPIPRNMSSASNSSDAAPLGPLSSKVKMPSRPKPGRKPIATENAADRRRTQNRNAQRCFRDKRAAKVIELENDVLALRRSNHETVAEYERKFAQHKRDAQDRHRELQQTIDALRQELADANKARYESTLSMGSNGFNTQFLSLIHI